MTPLISGLDLREIAGFGCTCNESLPTYICTTLRGREGTFTVAAVSLAEDADVDDRGRPRRRFPKSLCMNIDSTFEYFSIFLKLRKFPPFFNVAPRYFPLATHLRFAVPRGL